MDFKKKLMVICVSIIVVAFFLPWVSVGSQQIGNVAKLLTGKKQEISTSISGFQVPVLANSEESRLMITVIKIFQPNITNADKKSYLIWMIPLLAVGIFFVGNAFPDNKWLKLAFGVVGVLIFLIPTFKIITTDLDKVVLKVSIGYGLWLILVSYLGIGIMQICDFLQLNKSGK